MGTNTNKGRHDQNVLYFYAANLMMATDSECWRKLSRYRYVFATVCILDSILNRVITKSKRKLLSIHMLMKCKHDLMEIWCAFDTLLCRNKSFKRIKIGATLVTTTRVKSIISTVYFHIIVTSLRWWRHQMETFSALLALCEGGFTGDRWIPLTKASDAELRCFLWSAPEQTVE